MPKPPRWPTSPPRVNSAIGTAGLAAGGTVDGNLEVTGSLKIGTKLTLGNAAIEGGKFAAVIVADAVCGASNLGQVVLASASKRLYFCNGTQFLKLSACSGLCKAATAVACGQPVMDDCGDVSGCAGQGSACSAGLGCVNGVCKALGAAADPAVSTCKRLLAAAPATPSGSY